MGGCSSEWQELITGTAPNVWKLRTPWRTVIQSLQYRMPPSGLDTESSPPGQTGKEMWRNAVGAAFRVMKEFGIKLLRGMEIHYSTLDPGDKSNCMSMLIRAPGADSSKATLNNSLKGKMTSISLQDSALNTPRPGSHFLKPGVYSLWHWP